MCIRDRRDVVLLLIDAQGLDGRIVRSVDFSARGGLRPAFVFYEHQAMRVPERHATLAHLWAHGYTCWRWDGGNTWCVPLRAAREPGGGEPGGGEPGARESEARGPKGRRNDR